VDERSLHVDILAVAVPSTTRVAVAVVVAALVENLHHGQVHTEAGGCRDEHDLACTQHGAGAPEHARGRGRQSHHWQQRATKQTLRTHGDAPSTSFGGCTRRMMASYTSTPVMAQMRNTLSTAPKIS
jgi:hypothetical protein